MGQATVFRSCPLIADRYGHRPDSALGIALETA